MKKTNSVSFLVLGCVLLPLGILAENIYLKYSILFTSIILNVIAVVLNIREKKNNNL